ncbi:MAG: hypothetical protein AAFP68_02640 [Pseudomonadota bacterium]
MITFIHRHWHGLVLIAVLFVTALMASQVNSKSGPPRSVFVAWPSEPSAPELVLTPGQYSAGTWFVDLRAEGFAFSELCQAVSGPQTIGHAHIYKGDTKVAAAYVPRAELGALSPGQHRFRAVLRAQDHRALIGPDGLITAQIVIHVPGDADATMVTPH